ncbi:MAG: hypothetical protein AAF590_09135 [Pseudomonadota bacterium]
MPTTLPVRSTLPKRRPALENWLKVNPRVQPKPEGRLPSKRRFRWGLRHEALCFVLVFLATLFTCAYADASGQVGSDPMIEIIIERRADSVELYFGGNASSMIAYFSADQTLFTNGSGHVPFDAFQSGTWLLGDALLNGASLSMGSDLVTLPESLADGSPVTLEATSLMLHPATITVPFQDSVDAVMAVSICAVLDPPTDLRLQEANLYAGYIAFTDRAYDEILLRSPNNSASHNGGVSVRVRDYANGSLIGVWEQTWVADRPIRVEPVTTRDLPTSLSSLAVLYPLMGFVLFFGLFGTGALILSRRHSDQGPTTPQPIQARALPPS